VLEFLLEIQAIDLEIEALETEAARIPKQIDELDNEVVRHEQILATAKTRRTALEKERDALDLDLESKTETLNKWETQLYSIRTNKEYQAMLVEIGSIKTDISLLEDRILELMDEVEQASQTLERQKAALDTAIAVREERTNQLEAELEQLHAEIARLAERRMPLVPTDETDLYELYERIRSAKKGGPVVVPLDGNTCSSCHMHVPPQTINEIIADEKAHTCTCSRILYYPDNYPSAPAVDTYQRTES